MLFEGEYLNGKRHGKGKEYFYKALIFEGEYLFGEKWNGKGNIGLKDPEKEFELKNGNGNNIIEYENNFKGEYRNGKRNGKGTEYFFKALIFEGEYINGKRNGKGKEYHIYEGVDEFEGEYLNGKKFKGYGKEYISVGDDPFDQSFVLWFEGEYLYGIKWNGAGNYSTYWKNGYEYN